MQHDVNFIRHLATVRARFVNRIEEWLPAIEALQEDLNAAMSTKAELRDLRSRAHKVAGTAGSLGFPLLGKVARELERAIDFATLCAASVESIKVVSLAVNDFLIEARETIVVQQQVSRIMATEHDNDDFSVFLENEPVSSSPEQISRSINIMIVDDDEIFRSYIVGAFDQTGWTFDQVTDGKKALELLTTLADNQERKRPDLIIMDVEMPEMDGFTALESIKAWPTLEDVPVIMLTSKNEDIHMIKGYSKGAHEYLTKPVEISRLSNAVRGLLDQNI